MDIKLDKGQLTAVKVGSNQKGVIQYNGQVKSPGQFYSGKNNPTTDLSSATLKYDGRFHTTQIFSKSFFYASDEKQKKNIGPLEGGHAKVLELEPVTFDWIYNDSQDAGLIAQQVEKVIPEAVDVDEGDNYSLRTSTLIGYLVDSIHQLQAQIDELKNEK